MTFVTAFYDVGRNESATDFDDAADFDAVVDVVAFSVVTCLSVQ